jgi:hypothetical protein
MPTPSSGASEFILIPADTYKQLQRQPPDEPATTIERQAVLASNRIPESIKPKIISAIDRNPIRAAEEEEEEEEGAEEEASVVVDEPSTSENTGDSAAVETSGLIESGVGGPTTRERVFQTFDAQVTVPVKRTRARQIFDLVVAHKRISLEPHTQSFVVDGSTFNTIDAVTFLSDLQQYGKKLSDAYKQLVMLVKIPKGLLVNKYAKTAIGGDQMQPDHISTSTPISQPIVRRGGRPSLRPTTSPIRPLKRRLAADSGSEEEEEEETSRAEIRPTTVRQPTLDFASGGWEETENDFASLGDRDFEDVVTLGDRTVEDEAFHTPETAVRRPPIRTIGRAIDEARAFLSGENYSFTFD